MHQKLRVKQPALANRKGPIVPHDNARPHVSQITVQKLNSLKFETLPNPPYSPDLSPTDYHFFKHLNHFLNEKTFMNQEAVENAFEQFIVTRPPNFYKNVWNVMVLILINKISY
ncbi:Histone-lysine N-methyltransferase SETMAR [Habropoda laboriosa]|uniref:Histone-lysine N-methyltransferase SETMAR n=1 Tax=Habropoda laboriosa TaxID=597456 RepID=A0A0L7R7R8_9HYME|nr:Histone-lysine N-methyltransferase SETMAR [Habropoda laboriosa]